MSCHRFRMVAWNKQPRWGCSSPWEGVCQWGHWTRVPPPLWRAVSSLAAQRGRESSSSSTEEHWGGRWPCGRWSSSRCRSGEGSVTMVRAPYPSRQWWWRCASEKEGIHQHWDQWKSWGIEWKSRACQNSSQTSYVQWGSKSFRCKLWLVRTSSTSTFGSNPAPKSGAGDPAWATQDISTPGTTTCHFSKSWRSTRLGLRICAWKWSKIESSRLMLGYILGCDIYVENLWVLKCMRGDSRLKRIQSHLAQNESSGN